MLKHFCEKEDEINLIIFCDFVALIGNTLHCVNISPLLNITDYSCKKEILLSWISMGVFFPLCMVIDTKTCPFRNGLKSFLKVHYFFMHIHFRKVFGTQDISSLDYCMCYDCVKIISVNPKHENKYVHCSFKKDDTLL